MNFPFYNLGSWFEANAKVTEELKVTESNFELQVYRDPHTAIIDIVSALSRQKMAKRKIFYFEGIDPFFELPIRYFMSNSYEVQSLRFPDDLQDLSWIDQVDEKTLCVWLSRDFPFLNYYLELKEIEKKLTEKNTFILKLSRNYFKEIGLPTSLGSNDIEILHPCSSNCFALMGKRIKVSPVYTQGMDWSHFSLAEESLKLLNSVIDQSQMTDWESDKNWGVHFIKFPYGKKLSCYSSIYWEDLDGSAVVEEVLQRHPDWRPYLATPSLIFWGGLKTMNWMYKLGFKPNEVRGWVTLSREILSEKLFDELLEVRQLLLTQQGFIGS